MRILEPTLPTSQLNLFKKIEKIDSHPEKIQGIGLFSGAGGLDIGAHQAGVSMISSLDFEKDAIKTLQNNRIFQRTALFHADIREFSTKSYSKIIKKRKPEKLIILGGPPCQPFSKAGYWVGNSSRLGKDDPRNMIGEYLRVVSELKPDGFMMENVSSLLHPTNKDAVEALCEAIDKLGYHLKLVHVNAADFGVPQKRVRVFFVASHKPISSEGPLKTHGSEKDRKKNPLLLPHEGVEKWIGKFDKPEYFEKYEVAKGGTYYEDLLEVPPGKNYIALSARAGYPNPKFEAGKRFWSFLLKLHPDLPSWTIAAQPGPWVGPFHWTSRRLRVPEIAALQTFPADFQFHGSRRSIQRQIGNAVPPMLGKIMTRFLIDNI